MPARKTVDDHREPVTENSEETAKTAEIAETVDSAPQWESPKGLKMSDGLVTAGVLNTLMTKPELRALLASGIIDYTDGVVTWRTGHLEHIANLFAGDPLTTERDYADDLAVARAYSADVWAGLVEAARG